MRWVKRLVMLPCLFCLTVCAAFAAEDRIAGPSSPEDRVFALFSQMSQQPLSGMSEAALSQYVLGLSQQYFDFKKMTALATGRAWLGFSAEQKQALEQAFRKVLVQKYAKVVVEFQGYRLSLKNLVYLSEKDVVVETALRGTQDLSVDYFLTRHAEDGWFIYDLRVQGVSLSGNYRTVFASEIERNGVDHLIKMLSNTK